MRTLGLLLTATVLGAGCATRLPATAPSAPPDPLCEWDRVMSVPAGSDVQVMAGASAPSTRGSLVSADETRVTLTANGMANAIPRRSVTRVVAIPGKPYARFARLGALYGAIFGAGLLVEAGGAHPVGAALFGGAWAAIGATGGAVAAWKVPDRAVVYDEQSCNSVHP